MTVDPQRSPASVPQIEAQAKQAARDVEQSPAARETPVSFPLFNSIGVTGGDKLGNAVFQCSGCGKQVRVAMESYLTGKHDEKLHGYRIVAEPELATLTQQLTAAQRQIEQAEAANAELRKRLEAIERRQGFLVQHRDLFAKATIHRCKKCSCLWRRWGDGSWSLLDKHQVCKSCCDNEVMGEQIEEIEIGLEYKRLMDELATLRQQVVRGPGDLPEGHWAVFCPKPFEGWYFIEQRLNPPLVDKDYIAIRLPEGEGA